MPHVSRQKISATIKKSLEEKVIALLDTTSTKTRRQVFSELLTHTERLMLAKRLMLIFLVSQRMPTYTICKTLKMSPSSVARFQRRLEKGAYIKTVRWLRQNKIENRLIALVADVLAVPFTDKGKPMRLGKFLEEKI